MGDQVINAQRIRREEQRFYLNSDEISGVQTVQLQIPRNTAQVKFLGMHGKALVKTSRGPQVGTASVDAFIVSDDSFIPFTGEDAVNGYLLRAKNTHNDNLSFTSGFLTSYSNSCAIGQIPQIAAEFQVYGDVGNIVSSESEASGHLDFIATGEQPSMPLKIAAPGSMNITFDEFSSNRVQSYDISIGVSRTPIYSVGDRFPSEVKRNNPIEVNVGFLLEMNDSDIGNLREYPCRERINDLTLALNDVDDAEVFSYKFHDLHLVNVNTNSSVDETVTIEASYRGWIFF